jgi:class 3 adenylate cyclase
MGSPVPEVDAASLEQVIAQLGQTGLAATVFDPEWRMRWVSEEQKRLLDEWDEEALGYGRTLPETLAADVWRRALVPEDVVRWAADMLSWVLADAEGGPQEVIDRLSPDLSPDERAMIAEALPGLTPGGPHPLWVSSVRFVQGDLPPVEIGYVGLRLRDPEGRLLGTALLYAPDLPASILLMVTRGDRDMFARMARLVEPGRRRAAILFADLQSSTDLSRRLPSAAYFRLVRAATTAIDDVIVRKLGIVGKHAGDGVTAFFLEDDLGDVSAAARTAVEAAREIPGAAYEAAAALAQDADMIDIVGSYRINVGLHWGGALYMGQVVTGGRLEVTALGDAVNDCARIQQTARDGELLASKDLVERLGHEDAAALGIDPEALVYELVGEIEGAPEKALRDAAAIPVTSLVAGDRSAR